MSDVVIKSVNNNNNIEVNNIQFHSGSGDIVESSVMVNGEGPFDGDTEAYKTHKKSGMYTMTSSKFAVINGVTYPYKKHMGGNCVIIENGKVYVDGHELKKGKWKRTLKAFIKCYLLN